jgi:hypothetical protein
MSRAEHYVGGKLARCLYELKTPELFHQSDLNKTRTHMCTLIHKHKSTKETQTHWD